MSNLQIIPRPLHATLDYLWSGAIAAAPRLAGFKDDETAAAVCKAQAAVASASSMVTRYELGVFKVMPFRIHLMLDLAGGVFGLLSPWLLGFSGNKRARNTVAAFALLELMVVALSQREEM